MAAQLLDGAGGSYVFSDIQVFTEGKTPLGNEDAVAYSDTALILSDGATDKSGQRFESKTGGELAAKLVVEVCLRSEANGPELVAEATEALRELYKKINPNALKDPAKRFAATLVAARIVGDELVVTQLGDSSLRLNGTDVYKNDKLIDALTAGMRAGYIRETSDVDGSRAVIMPLLEAQHRYQNNPDHPLGYGVIDGTDVPAKFIKVFTFPADSITTLEQVSDGYYGRFPRQATLEAYHALYTYIQQTDPFRCGEFASTKSNDDRTVAIARIGRAAASA